MARTAQPYVAYAPVSQRTSGVAGADRTSRSTEGSKTLAALLLAAVLAALLVVADQLVDTWADGHLLAAWVIMWSVAFAALALLAPPLRQLASYAAAAAGRWAQESAERRMEAAMWEYAKHDQRIMEELQQAWQRGRN